MPKRMYRSCSGIWCIVVERHRCVSEGRRRSIILTWKDLVLVFFLDDRRFDFESDLMLELYGAMIGSEDGPQGCIGVADGFGVS